MIVHALTGARAETGSRGRGNEVTQADGLSGLKALGVRDLNYRLAFLACNVKACNKKVGLVCALLSTSALILVHVSIRQHLYLCVFQYGGICTCACFSTSAFVLVRVSVRRHLYLCVFQYGGIDTCACFSMAALILVRVSVRRH